MIDSVTVRQNVEIIRASDVALREHSSMKHTKMKNLPLSGCTHQTNYVLEGVIHGSCGWALRERERESRTWKPTRKYTMQENNNGKTICTSISAIILAT